MTEKKPVKVLTYGAPLAPFEQAALEKLPTGAEIVAKGSTPSDFANLSEEDWKEVEVIVVTGHGAKLVEVGLVFAKEYVNFCLGGCGSSSRSEMDS